MVSALSVVAVVDVGSVVMGVPVVTVVIGVTEICDIGVVSLV